MSESDSSIPGKVTALAEALKAIVNLIGWFKPLDLAFLNWHRDEGSESWPWDNDREDERKKLLAAVAAFVEAVDTAERLLNAIPVKDLEPLSSFTGGVRWDMQTRRTLIRIQIITSVLPKYSTDPDFLLSKAGIGSKACFDKMLHELIEFTPELNDRILDLKSLPDDQSEPMGAIISQRIATQEPVANPNENTKRDGNSNELSSKTETPTKTDEKLPQRLRKDSPSRVKAKAAFDYAMERISNAHAMTAVELFDAIREDGEAKEMLPPTAESFTKYLNDCGIRLRKSDTKPSGRSTVQRSDM
jgi:hypothetical protein